MSHTTDDLVFEWEEDVPLDVWKNIELPQLQLEGNYTNDCTQVYATGNTDMLTQQKSQTRHSFLFRQLYMPRSSFRLEAPPRILHVSYLHTNMFNCRYVCKLKRDYLMFWLLTLINYCTFLVGILLDKAWSGSCPSYSRCYISSDALNATCQIASSPTARVIFKSCWCFYVNLHYVSLLRQGNAIT